MRRPPAPLTLGSPELASAVAAHERVLLYGDMGTGKTTLAGEFATHDAHLYCVSADPGSPAFGAPGAVNLARRHADNWHVLDTEPLCSLDAARFRLPLMQAVRRLVQRAPNVRLVIDAPGVIRGVGGAETLFGLVEAVAADLVLVLARVGEPLPLAHELDALGVPLYRLSASPEAHRPTAPVRVETRTRLWEDFLAGATEHELALERLALLGTPPPAAACAAWRGRQIALLCAGRAVAFGEALAASGNRLTARLAALTPTPVASADALLVRDAARATGGALATAPPTPARAARVASAPAQRRCVTAPFHVESGALAATLVNGVFGDPLLELQIRGASARVLFDLGDAAALSARAAHAVTDVFVTHAHFDHICGFPQLLRARLGGSCPPCRLYGPPGMAAHVAGFVSGVHWDRIGDAGPEFQVAEVFPERLVWTRIKAGCTTTPMGDSPIHAGVLLQNAAYRVRHTRLDHAIDVLAFTLELPGRHTLRAERLPALGLTAGPWIAEFKRRLIDETADATIDLPNGRRERIETLRRALIDSTPGPKLAYATDLADTPDNRERLVSLAESADVFFCEATFRDAERANATRTQHLTTRASAEIAVAARVKRLAPFHFSRRYTGEIEAIYAEIEAALRAGSVTPRLSRYSS